jgi:molybdate transport system substrate-binding protein
LLCTTVLKSSLDETLPQFEREHDCKVEVSYGPTAQLLKRLSEGETTDAAVLTSTGFDEMVQAGRLVAASRKPVARSTTMVAVKKGTPKPDISTLEAFRQAMLDARSLVYSGPGAGIAGAHMVKVMDQLGIAEAMKPKTILGPGGPAGLIGNYLVRGDAELGIQMDSELMAVPGVEIVGPLPAEIGLIAEFVFGVHGAAADRAKATALGAFMRGPQMRAAMTAKGLTPV